MALLPDARVRRRALPPLFTAGVRDARAVGEVHVARAGGALSAVACWLPPGVRDMGARRQLRVLPAATRAALVAPSSVRGLLALEARIDALRPREPHWYLAVVGVEPAYQGTGVGGALLRPTLARADAEGLPAYLETPTRPNVRFYEGLGFEVVEETPLLPGGPPNWTMLRAPRAA